MLSAVMVNVVMLSVVAPDPIRLLPGLTRKYYTRRLEMNAKERNYIILIKVFKQ
jgi:hypothetical protein